MYSVLSSPCRLDYIPVAGATAETTTHAPGDPLRLHHIKDRSCHRCDPRNKTEALLEFLLQGHRKRLLLLACTDATVVRARLTIVSVPDHYAGHRRLHHRQSIKEGAIGGSVSRPFQKTKPADVSLGSDEGGPWDHLLPWKDSRGIPSPVEAHEEYREPVKTGCSTVSHEAGPSTHSEREKGQTPGGCMVYEGPACHRSYSERNCCHRPGTEGHRPEPAAAGT